MKTKADFPLPLQNYVDVDRDGHASFSYAYQTGALIATLDRAKELADLVATQTRAADRIDALKRLQEYLGAWQEERALLDGQWKDYLGLSE